MQLAGHKLLNLRQSLECDNGERIVRIEPPMKTDGHTDIELWQKDDFTLNIYRLTKDNDIVWQIKPTAQPFSDDDPFADITCINEGESSYIKASRWSGDIFKLDVITGNAEKIGWSK